MSTLGKGLLECLSGQDGDLVNIKFYRGSNGAISKDQILEEVCSAIKRRASGEVKAKAMPKWRSGKVDLHARMASL